MPHALIVHAHPESNSFCTAQMREAVLSLHSQGYTVDISDLYRMDWTPTLGRADFTHELNDHFKPGPEQLRAHREGSFAPDVAAELEKLQRADLLVFSFPMWWFSLPAILKGWVDRVFAMGVAYGGDVGTFDNGGFRGRRAMLLFTTGSLEEHFGPGSRDGEMDVLLFHILHGMFWFCGFTALESVVSFAPTKGTPQSRDQQLLNVRSAFSDLPSRAVKFG